MPFFPVKMARFFCQNNSPNLALKRVQKELADLKTCQEIGIRAEPMEDDLMNLSGEIEGAPETTYEGATFKLSIKIPPRYPFLPPEIAFDTPIWHPNIWEGTVCLDILEPGQWSGAMDIRTALLSIQAMLSSPGTDDPMNVAASRQYIDDRVMYERTARNWTQAYAGAITPPDAHLQEKIQTLKDMGVHEARARDLLSLESWDLKMAVSKLENIN